MSHKTDILSRFTGATDALPLFVPDFTLWYDTHSSSGTLPAQWENASLPQISRDLGLPVWSVARPWRIETPGVEIRQTEEEGQRLTEIETSAGTLASRWSLGSDGSWWQLEYPVKTAADLDAALELARARTYIVDLSDLEERQREVGDDGVLAAEIPTRPYADLLYDMVGMSEGIMLLMESPPAMGEFLAILEEKLQTFVGELAELSVDLFFSPDNLDGQFIPPPTFDEHLAPSYRRTTDLLSPSGKPLLVHAGGPVGRLLEPLAQAGVAGVEGVAPPPQSDATLSQARELAGPDFTLWGGIPQDFVLATRSAEEFETAVAQAVGESSGDGRAILGIADRIPVDADLERLRAIPALIEKTLAQ